MLLAMFRAVVGGGVGLLVGAIAVIILNQMIIVANGIDNPSNQFSVSQSQINGLIDMYMNLAAPDPLAPWKIIMELVFIIAGALDANGFGVVSYSRQRR